LLKPLFALWLVSEDYRNSDFKYKKDIRFWTYFMIVLIGSTYSYIWDIYMDWGLMRCFEEGKWGLRDKINYKPAFYYWAIFSDFVLRFLWILGLFAFGTAGAHHTFYNF
jgi:hypothetical protein